MGKTFVIGDIHGCYSLLKALLQKTRPDPAHDTVIVLGDFVNRGPDTNRVITLLLTLRRKFNHFIALKGNHEEMMLDYLAGNGDSIFLQVGGRQTLASYGITDPLNESSLDKIPPEHIQFLHDLLLYWEDDEYIYVHAGLKPGVHITQQTPDWLLWAREQFITSDYDFGKRVIFGHTPFAAPLIEENKIGIDTGAVYGGSLTCLILPDLQFVRVTGGKQWPPRQ